MSAHLSQGQHIEVSQSRWVFRDADRFLRLEWDDGEAMACIGTTAISEEPKQSMVLPSFAIESLRAWFSDAS